jgi:hypothetical protein
VTKISLRRYSKAGNFIKLDALAVLRSTKRKTSPLCVNNKKLIETLRIEESRFRGGVDDVIIIPFVFAALTAKSIIQRIVSILIDILDYAFPLFLQLVRAPLFAVRVLGDVLVATLNGVLSYVPIPEATRKRWGELIRENWSWFRQKITYKAFEEAVHRAFEAGMAWVFRKCKHLTPNAALLVITGAILWLPISLGAATAMHVFLLAKAASWPAWMQFLHPLATLIAKSKLLVLPVYPAAWPQAKKHPFIQFIFESYQTFRSLYLIRKMGFRYRQTERFAMVVIDNLVSVSNNIGLTRAVMWFHDKLRIIEDQSAKKPSQQFRSFFERWSIKFTAKYYEDKERDGITDGA